MVIFGVIFGVVNTAAPQSPNPSPSASTSESPEGAGADTRPGTPVSVNITGSPSEVYSSVYNSTIDSVVSIRVGSSASTNSGQGSGFIYDSEGHVVTNQHVVQDSEDVWVRFNQGDWREATVIGTDVYTDLAVLRVDDPPTYADPLPVASSDPKRGQVVLALGNPLGYEASVTHGIVSGLDRSMRTRGGFAIPDAVQTDTPINPGNSGGPLVNLKGEVVGVNRAKQGDNLGFAISPEMVSRVVPELIQDGDYSHSYLGVSTMPVTPAVAEANGLEDVRGILVVDVIDDGPSEGILEPSSTDGRMPTGGDVIVGIGGMGVDSSEDLASHLATETRPGDTVEVTVVHDGDEKTVEVTLGDRPENP